MRGVTWNQANRRWRATLNGYGHRGYIGEFLTEGEASSARRAAEVALFGQEFDSDEIVVDGPVARIPLLAHGGRRVAWALIDTVDVPAAENLGWCLSHNRYAVARIGRAILYLHRLIEPLGEVVDHINRDTLDNRRANLRPCTQRENSRNRRGWLGTASGVKGVRQTRNGRFEARITVDRRGYSLGAFDTVEDAGRAYDRAALRFFGEFAHLNFPAPGRVEALAPQPGGE